MLTCKQKAVALNISCASLTTNSPRLTNETTDSRFLDSVQYIFEGLLQVTNRHLVRRQEAKCGHTDRHDKANSRFSQFCERA
jgi:hypothetical protein